MSLTIETHDLLDVADDVTSATDTPRVQALSVEHWLDVMYGIRPDAALRATFVPIAYDHGGDVAEWLETMWGVGAGRSFPTASATRSA